MKLKVSVIDLFAGPGGLGEGFSSFYPKTGKYRPFNIEMSVEKEESAHRTLELRAFFRQFRGEIPDEYYQYLKGDTAFDRDKLFEAFPAEYANAIEETLGGPRELGTKKDDDFIQARLRELSKRTGPWVVIGGPPCQAYSLVGRSRNKGTKGYRAENDNRHFLYEEYLRVLSIIKPEVFVMENVKGIISAKVNKARIFPTLLKDLKHPSRAVGARGGNEYKIYSLVYRPQEGEVMEDKEYTIRAEKYGIPQTRHRVILLGIRSDLSVKPDLLKAIEGMVTTRNVISDLPSLRSGITPIKIDSPEMWRKAVKNGIDKVKKSAPSSVDKSVLCSIEKRVSILSSRGKRFASKPKKFKGSDELASWYLDERLNGVTNHDTRGHMAEDLARYLFCALYAKKHGVSPRAKNFPTSFIPKHVNWKSGKFIDRFKVQLTNRPSSTITSHISKDGHYYIHPDPSQCRSLTVREAARLQTFPDNYFFEGTRTEQYVQVGNAVPPLLARQIAAIVYKLLETEAKA